MPLNEKQLDALDKQHQESLKNYSDKVQELQAEITRLTDDVRDLNTVVSNHVQEKQKELNDKISDTEKLKLEAITMKKEAQNLLYEAQAKIEDANKIYDDMLKDAEAHDLKVKNHIDSVSYANSDIDKRIAQCVDKESRTSIVLLEANKRIELALMSEEKSQEELSKLIFINNSIKEDIESQKDFYFKNKQILDEINLRKSELIVIQEKSNKELSDALEIKNNCSIAQARIEKSSQELIKRNEECASREIQNQIITQQLKDRKLALDGQEGRLNELRNNVNILLEKQQMDESSKEGKSL